MAEPVRTIGASAPTDPPNPMVIADAMTDDQQLCAFSRLRFVDMAYSTRVIPWEMLSLTIYFINNDVSHIPMIGNTRNIQFSLVVENPETSRVCI